ncbi:MAG: leucine-rich repeat domain-containing protein [Verrucomicrobia bacterium]|nr:leucine-rich repeat domain-containing protein [Verrucomicrobiota bacterium]
MKKIGRMAFFAIAVTTSLTWNSQAEVIVKKFDPPFQAGDSVFAGDTYSAYSTLNIRVDSTGTADFQIPYSLTGISFSSPTEIIVGKEDLWETRLIGGLAFDSTIGENIVEHEGNEHVWSSEIQTGQNIYFLATLIQSVVPLSLDAEPPSVGYVSEIRGREGIIGFRFQHEDPYGGYTMHYGYFHFDFSENSQSFPGEKGYLLGWAYETEPNKPIIAKPLNSLSEAASPVSDFTYEIQEGQVTITAYTGSDEHVVIPSEIEGLPVKAIGETMEEYFADPEGFGYAFASNKTLKSVVIPDTVELLGAVSFGYCEALETIQFSTNLQVIDENAFFSCRALKEVILPDSLQELGKEAFQFCTALEKVKLPANLERIGDRCFIVCTNLVEIALPATVREIGEEAFRLCNKLPSVDLSNIQTLKAGAFAGCFQLENVAIPEDWEVLEDGVFSACTSFTEIQLPKNLKKIGARALNGCTNLTEIIIPESVTVIGGEAFRGCNGLTQMTLPEGLSELGEGVFRKCINLTNIVLPDGITELGESLFRDCAKLTEVQLSEQITKIGDNAFATCSSLTGMVLPSGVTEVGAGSFLDCAKLKKVLIEGQITTIGDGAFSGCEALETITLPYTLTHLGLRTFTDCSALSRVYFKGNTPLVTFRQLPQYPQIPETVFSEPYPTLYYLEGTTGWGGEYYVDQFGNFIEGEAPPSGAVIIFPIVGIRPSPLSSQMRPVNWWTEGAVLKTWTLPADEPEVFIPKKTVKDGKVEMTLVFGGALQSSTNLKDWEPVETASPYLVNSSSGTREYYRVHSEIAD